VSDQATGEITAIVITANNFRVAQSTETPEGTNDGWLVVAEGEHTFDLLKVVGQEESLGISELAPGTYNQARMDIISVVITRGGEQVEASVPSSVLRIVRPFDVIAGETTILTFDFDADRSVVATGPNLLLRPVVKRLVRKGDEAFVPEPIPTPTATPAPTPSPTPTPTPAPTEFILQIEDPVDAEPITSSATLTVRGRTRADAAITVNDTFLTPDIDGIFSVDLTLEIGANIIEVVASIETGEELSAVLTVIYIP
jgi:hypothetical protein